jgi:putative transposase
MIRRYTFKMSPNVAQSEALFEVRYLVCQLYNALIEQRRDAWDRRRISLTKFSQSRECTILRQTDERYKALGSGIMERCCERVDQAYKKYFDNVKAWRRGQWQKPYPPSPPGYQRTSEFSGFGVRENGKGWGFNGCKIRVKGLPCEIRIDGRFPVEPDAIRTADIMFRDERWWISIVVNLPDTAAMRAATERFSDAQPSNFPYLTKACNDIGLSDPSLGGRAQASSCLINLDLVRRFGTLTDADGAYAINIEPAKAKSGPRGAKNRRHRQALAIRRRDYALHELTTALACRYSNITVSRPKLLEITKSGAGDSRNHGAMVAWKADFNRDVLDYGAGKFCEMLAYKTASRGNKLTIAERDISEADIPNKIVAVAKAAKQARRASKRARKGAIYVPTRRNFPGEASNHPAVAKGCAGIPCGMPANVG